MKARADIIKYVKRRMKPDQTTTPTLIGISDEYIDQVFEQAVELLESEIELNKDQLFELVKFDLFDVTLLGKTLHTLDLADAGTPYAQILEVADAWLYDSDDEAGTLVQIDVERNPRNILKNIADTDLSRSSTKTGFVKNNIFYFGPSATAVGTLYVYASIRKTVSQRSADTF